MPERQCFEGSHAEPEAPRSDGGAASLALALLEGATSLHASEHSGPDTDAVQIVERALPGAAAAILGSFGDESLVAMRAAGARWRRSEFESEDWLSRRAGCPGELAWSGRPTSVVVLQSPTGGSAHVVTAPIPVGGRASLVLVVVSTRPVPLPEPAPALLASFARHVGVALDRSSASPLLTRAGQELAEEIARGHRTESLAVLGQLARGLAHELNNGLTTVIGTADCLASTLPEESVLRPDITRIRDAAIDVADLVRRVRLLRPSPDTAGRENADVVELIESAIDITRGRLAAAGQREARHRFEIKVLARPVVRANGVEWREMLAQLLMNGVEATPAGGRITVTVGQEGLEAWVDIRDDGPGLAPDLGDRAFDPFVTTKRRRGAGLGLSVCWMIARAHDGHIAFRQEEGTGAVVRISVPCATAHPIVVGARHPGGAAAARTPAGGLRILLVDDDEDVRTSVGDLLTVIGHTVCEAGSADEAQHAFAEADFDLVISDYGMPGRSGVELARVLKTLRPDVPFLLLTGLSSPAETQGERAISLVLHKPVSLATLRDAVARLAGSNRAGTAA